MWIRDLSGRLVNLNTVRHIEIDEDSGGFQRKRPVECYLIWAVVTDEIHYDLAKKKTREEAEKLMDKFCAQMAEAGNFVELDE